MNQLTEITKIENLIYEVRGHQVMLDRDLAKLYDVETRMINQSVKRNIERFPIEFCFQMSEIEFQNWKSQIVMSNNDKIGLRRPPYVFTEQGVAMLSTILKSKTAIVMSIKIMNAFVAMRKYFTIANYNQRLNNIETKVIEHDNKFDEIFSKLEKEPNNHIFFEGQIYDAYSLMVDILNHAKKSIIVIDNYIDKKLLDILSKINKEVIVITKYTNNIDLEKYNKQYNNIRICINTSFHDRFIILDETILYHCGASFKDLGYKCFAINKIEDKNYLKELLNHLDLLEMSW